METDVEVPLVKKTLVLGIIGVLLTTAFFTLAYYSSTEGNTDEVSTSNPTHTLPERFVILVEEPRGEWGHIFVTCLSSLSSRDNYNPLFILDEGALDEHQLWTIRNSMLLELPKILFTNDTAIENNITTQVDNLTVYPADPAILATFTGFQGRSARPRKN